MILDIDPYRLWSTSVESVLKVCGVIMVMIP